MCARRTLFWSCSSGDMHLRMRLAIVDMFGPRMIRRVSSRAKERQNRKKASGKAKLAPKPKATAKERPDKYTALRCEYIKLENGSCFLSCIIARTFLNSTVDIVETTPSLRITVASHTWIRVWYLSNLVPWTRGFAIHHCKDGCCTGPENARERLRTLRRQFHLGHRMKIPQLDEFTGVGAPLSLKLFSHLNLAKFQLGPNLKVWLGIWDALMQYAD